MNKIITLIIVLIIFFYLSYKKCQKEHFDIKEELKIYFDKNKTMLWTNNEKLDNINYSIDTITFNKSNEIYYSNEKIFNELSNVNGLILKPFNDIKDFTIGFINDNENINENENNLNYGIKFLGNNYIQIIENNEIINMDYCFDKNITNCEKTNDKYKFRDHDILGMNIINSRMNYFIIKNKEDNFKGIRIHRSKGIANYPLSAVVINKNRKNKIQNNVWTTSLLIPPPSPWSVEYTSLIKYNQREMPKQVDLDREEVIVEAPAPVIVKEEVDPFMKVINILEANLYENKKLIIKCEVNNINQNYLNKLYESSIRLTLNDDKNINLLIPINSVLTVNRQNKLNDIEIDLSEYINYFYRKEFTAEVMFRRSRSLSQQFNIISNKVLVEKV